MELYSESGSVYGKRILDAVRLGDENLRQSYPSLGNKHKLSSHCGKKEDKDYQKEGV